MKKIIIGIVIIVVLIGAYFIYQEYFTYTPASDYETTSVAEAPIVEVSPTSSVEQETPSEGKIPQEFAEHYQSLVSLYGSVHDKIESITSLSMDLIEVNAQMQPINVELMERMDYDSLSALVDQDWHEFPAASHRYSLRRHHYCRDETGRERLEQRVTRLSRQSPIDYRIKVFDGTKTVSYSPFENRAVVWSEYRSRIFAVPRVGFTDLIGKWLATAGEQWLYDYFQIQVKEAREFITGISKIENDDSSVTYRVSYRVPSLEEYVPGSLLAKSGLHYDLCQFTFDEKGRLLSFAFRYHEDKKYNIHNFKDYVERGGMEVPTRWISRYFNGEGKEINGVYTIINPETLQVNVPIKDEFSIALPSNVQIQSITQ